MGLECKHCGGKVRANKQKIAAVLGTTGAMVVMGAILTTPIGWLSLIPAALAGSAKANQLLKLKVRLAHASQNAGDYFWCDDCQRGIPLSEVFGN